ncbi:MAG: Fe-S protein assembly co-chaperone HscB [Phycisphaerales bacterium]|nr:Fe-S protein assembly co-chaperone HscB [Phycisphaerales bacterium]
MNPVASRGARSSPAKCTSCERILQTPLFCDACHTLCPADGRSHFEILGVEPTFALDADNLRQRYLQLSREVHPDRQRPDDLSLSLRSSAQLNEAYRVLSDPLLRAEYLLELCGGASSQQDKAVPQNVLTETLMLRDEIEEARQTGDAAALEAVRARVQATHDAVLARIVGMASELPGDDALRARLRVELNSIRYYQRALSQFE